MNTIPKIVGIYNYNKRNAGDISTFTIFSIKNLYITNHQNIFQTLGGWSLPIVYMVTSICRFYGVKILEPLAFS